MLSSVPDNPIKYEAYIWATILVKEKSCCCRDCMDFNEKLAAVLPVQSAIVTKSSLASGKHDVQ
jgi:hypothetical protein